ncbi:MAG: hypothetical protein IT488_12460 [Gammaproteobacteria bacterium]|nr:hypothetical protein [Gammaproteobacteria bacterium]
MGFFNRFMDKGRGLRLWSDYKNKISPAISQIRHEKLNRALNYELYILSPDVRVSATNMTLEGRKKYGMELQMLGLSTLDSDMCKSLAYWIAGATLEAASTNTPECAEFMEEIERVCETLFDFDINTPANPSLQNTENHIKTYETFESWYKIFCKSAADVNSQLMMNDKDGSSLIDYMDHDPLKRAFKDGVDPVGLGRDFAKEFDITTFGQ